jgi:hypothetical protein
VFNFKFQISAKNSRHEIIKFRHRHVKKKKHTFCAIGNSDRRPPTAQRRRPRMGVWS